jgi:hypothetical protein
LAAGFATAMSQSLWLPVIGFALGAVVVLFFARPRVTVSWGGRGAAPGAGNDGEPGVTPASVATDASDGGTRPE